MFSCVLLVSGFEMMGYEIMFEDVIEVMNWSGIIGLGEMMNFSGVINVDFKMFVEMVVM